MRSLCAKVDPGRTSWRAGCGAVVVSTWKGTGSMGAPTSEAIRGAIDSEIASLLQEDGKPVPDLRPESVLLETGLDSLGCAVLVTRLEDVLGYDPFTLMDDPVYPRTIQEFVTMYETYAPE